MARDNIVVPFKQNRLHPIQPKKKLLQNIDNALQKLLQTRSLSTWQVPWSGTTRHCHIPEGRDLQQTTLRARLRQLEPADFAFYELVIAAVCNDWGTCLLQLLKMS